MNGNIWVTMHFSALAGLFLYGLHRIWILINWHREKKKKSPAAYTPSFYTLQEVPLITVQLPLYNERFVAVRILDAAANLEWPVDRLEIQILDDSTDDTRKIVDNRAAYWICKGVNMRVIRREVREGYKAGALNRGLEQAGGEFIAIFDADFLPADDFLKRTIPYFSDTKTGMVQAKWGFVNAEHSWFTRIQSLLLGQHFTIEHFTRFRKGLFFNFNGTAGIWRREAIESAGGWKPDTVTEDLDLSYRAELAGWRFVYLDDLVVPSELPVTMASFRSQQQRWAKGSIQTAKKILPHLFASDLPFSVKCEAAAHLLSNVCWLLAAVVTLTLYATITWRITIGPYQMLRVDLPLFLGTSFLMFLYFFIYAVKQKGDKYFCSLFMLPVLSIGIAPVIALSVLRGIFEKGGNFQRTPKFGIRGKERLTGLASVYRQKSIPYLIMNTCLLIYSILPLIFAFERETWAAMPFLFIFPLGFSLAIAGDFRELIRQ